MQSRERTRRRYAFKVTFCSGTLATSLSVVERRARAGSKLDSNIESRYGDRLGMARFYAIREASSGTAMELSPAEVKYPGDDRPSSGFL